MGKRLGKGLEALLSDYNQDEELVQEISIKDCRPNPYQPRQIFDEEAIQELKKSIQEYGIIQPLIVRKSIKGYEIVVGERRLRAAKEAGLDKIPVIVKELTDHRMMELALLENLQREDLTPIEEAYAYKKLIEELKITQEVLSNRLGKSRSHIANIMRLLSLPKEVINAINDGHLSMGHGRALLTLKNEQLILDVFHEILEKNLNVRQVEKIVQKLTSNKKEKPRPTRSPDDIFLLEKETILMEKLGTNVKIQKGKRKGKIEIEFYSNEDLERIIDALEA